MSHIIAVPFLGTGGAENVALGFAKAIREIKPDCHVLIVVADRAMVDARVQQFPGVHVAVLQKYTVNDSYALKQQLLEDLIVALRPAVFHNINSEVGWSAIINSGAKLGHYTRLFASIFAFQFAPDGVKKIGYAAYFLQPGLPALTALLSDNKRFVIDAIDEYGLAEAGQKLKAVYNPSRIATVGWKDRALARLARTESGQAARRPSFLWAGRLDKEKRVDLFLEIVARMPQADFYVYGQTVVDSGEAIPRLPNLHLKGPFASPEELVAERLYDAFIFTSKWEGLPNILVEMGTLGIPIVAATVGGVGELIMKQTGYPLPEKATIDDYLTAMNDVIAHPSDARERARALVELIDQRHTWEAFIDSVKGIRDYDV
ncbi:glycosyl transferase group 1 [Burkholderia sp. MR1]|nr:glycosyl transferase group 1 [Burkholderia sp. MR1]